MDLKSAYKIGYILKPHGLKGQVTVSLDAEAPADLADIDTLFVEKNNQLIPYFRQDISVSGTKAYLKFEDINTPEQAKEISKSALYLPKSSRPKSGRGEFYDDEVIGFEVNDTNEGNLGSVTAITTAGPNKLLTLIFNGKEVLIPINGPFVKSINKSKKTISVELPEGFLDI
ncbi:MAG TPA: ribosome maturation factor RimM [Chryseosolibacter sp.]